MNKTASQLIAAAAPQEHVKTAGAWADVYDNVWNNRYANGNGDMVNPKKPGKGWNTSVATCFEGLK